MYQFRREDMALQAARLLAVYETQPIVVMARGLMDFYTIGPINNVAVHEAGRHMATVYRSGHVDHMGLARCLSPSCSHKWESEKRQNLRVTSRA
jgi:hypothetical protein